MRVRDGDSLLSLGRTLEDGFWQAGIAVDDACLDVRSVSGLRVTPASAHAAQRRRTSARKVPNKTSSLQDNRVCIQRRR